MNTMLPTKLPNLIDIAANLVDSMYSGVYNGTKKHEPDIDQVLLRAWDAGVNKIIITGTSLDESKKALSLSTTHHKLFCSVGCHPTNCTEIHTADNPNEYLSDMAALIRHNTEKVVAIGEFGLDYDRLHFCPKEVQLRWFEEQLVQLAPLGLPLFLHCRNAAADLLEILSKHKSLWAPSGGVVHSFDGTCDEADTFIQLGFHIGINGCSLKTKENLETVKKLPRDRMLLETDSPWCDIRPSHAGSSFIKNKLPFNAVKKEKWIPNAMIKGRNEPCTALHVLDIVAGVRGEDVNALGEQIYKNTCGLFFNTNRTH